MKILNEWNTKKGWCTPTIFFVFELSLRNKFYVYIDFSISKITLFGFDWGYDGRHSAGFLGFWIYN